MSFSADDGDGGIDVNASDTAATETGGRDASGEAGPLPPDVDPEGGTKEAGTADVVVVEAGGGCCDCDKDTYIDDAGNGGTCMPDGSLESSGDCDDTIGALNPGSGYLLNTNWPSSHQPAFDWNCDGVVTKQLNHDLNCASLALLGLGCEGEGFQDDPPCGAQANYIKCVAGGLLGTTCSATQQGLRKQACK